MHVIICIGRKDCFGTMGTQLSQHARLDHIAFFDPDQRWRFPSCRLQKPLVSLLRVQMKSQFPGNTKIKCRRDAPPILFTDRGMRIIQDACAERAEGLKPGVAIGVMVQITKKEDRKSVKGRHDRLTRPSMSAFKDRQPTKNYVAVEPAPCRFLGISKPNSLAALSPRMLRFSCSLRNGMSQMMDGVSKSQ